MKYKRDKKLLESIPEAARDWPVGTVCSHPEYGKCTYIGPRTQFGVPDGKASVTIGPPEGSKSYQSVQWSDLTPIEAWVPEVGERVVVWDGGNNVRIREYAGGREVIPEDLGTVKNLPVPYKYIARIPDGLPLKDADFSAQWWQANAEIYEAES